MNTQFNPMAVLCRLENDIIHGTRCDDVLNGQNGNDFLFGHGGNDCLFGGNGWDYLNGGQGHDVLSGGNGWDFLSGGCGNDALFGGNGCDVLKGGRGNDHLFGGNGLDRLVGGKGADQQFGGKGTDFINGGKGRDVLTGGSGCDRFDFTDLGQKNADIITDFQVGQDRLKFRTDVFKGIDAGKIDACQFAKGDGMTQAKNADQRFILDTKTGNLYYDADGSGCGKSQLVATLKGDLCGFDHNSIFGYDKKSSKPSVSCYQELFKCH